jgi:hypothetical protein
MNRPHFRALAVAAGIFAGCGAERDRDPVVPIDQVPEAALKAAGAKLPGVRFDGAWKVRDGDREAFEIRGRTPEGKIRDVKVTASGEVLEVD